MARCVSAQDQVNLAKNLKTCYVYDVTHRKSEAQTIKSFLIKTRRLAESLDGLNI